MILSNIWKTNIFQTTTQLSGQDGIDSWSTSRPLNVDQRWHLWGSQRSMAKAPRPTKEKLVNPVLFWEFRDTFWCHKTWLAGKIPMQGGFDMKVTYKWSIFQHAMFDHWRVDVFGTWTNWRNHLRNMVQPLDRPCECTQKASFDSLLDIWVVGIFPLWVTHFDQYPHCCKWGLFDQLI